MKKLIRGAALTAAILNTLAVLCTAVTTATIPDNIYVRTGTEVLINGILPIKAEPSEHREEAVGAAAKGGGKYMLKVFGILPAKEVTVRPAETTCVIAGGEAFGVKLYSRGVMAIGFSDIGNGGSPAYNAGIRAGDIIISLNGLSVTTNDEVSDIISKSDGKKVTATVERNGKRKETEITPEKDGFGIYKSGMWVRDSTAGIGTISYYDPKTGIFAGLGHGITDPDTGKIFPLQSGEGVSANISSVNRGKKGHPGDLCGILTQQKLGSLFGNTECGIFGKSDTELKGELLPVAMKQEVHKGKAVIKSTVDGNEPKEYSVEIVGINYNSSAATKNMIIKVTDKELLKKTGGIVRGMSGSPIIQDGKLVGAVTHVFVDDPTGGYAIFAENMLAAADELIKQAA